MFDIAGTLTSIDVWKGLTASPAIDPARLRRLWRGQLPFYALYKLRLLSEYRFRHVWVNGLAKLVKGMSQAEIEAIFNWMIEDYLTPYYRHDVIDELQQHKANGVYVVLVSNMFAAFSQQFAAKVGADYGIGTQLAFADGRATGQIEGKPCAGPEKIQYVVEHLQAVLPSVSLQEQGAGYADSFSDRALLGAVKVPTATYPDTRLASFAQEQGWRILQ